MHGIWGRGGYGIIIISSKFRQMQMEFWFLQINNTVFSVSVTIRYCKIKPTENVIFDDIALHNEYHYNSDSLPQSQKTSR